MGFFPDFFFFFLPPFLMYYKWFTPFNPQFAAGSPHPPFNVFRVRFVGLPCLLVARFKFFSPSDVLAGVDGVVRPTPSSPHSLSSPMTLLLLDGPLYGPSPPLGTIAFPKLSKVAHPRTLLRTASGVPCLSPACFPFFGVGVISAEAFFPL